ncbi:hypothetical protein H6F89_28270 [Cyanobacteria bacterium FACHB-63]|nr:hypothetical protein [Cyanobacteria bacterium FACHB-63]
MEKRPITVSLSTSSVTLRPGKQSAEFEVNVRNDSDRQAQFELEVVAPGSTRAAAQWYRLFPEVSVAKPPGDETNFQVQVFDTPLPNFVGTVTLTIRVTSPQIEGETRKVLRLAIEPGVATTPLSLRLIPAQVQTYPRQLTDLAIEVRNLTQSPIEVLLRCLNLTPSWLINGAERRILLNPGSDQSVTFQCQPPAVTQAPSQTYPFWIEASIQGQAIARSEGTVAVLPIGFIKFEVTPEAQTIPKAKFWWLQWKKNDAVVEVVLENLSNVRQLLQVETQAKPQNRCQWEPSINVVLGLGEATRLPISVRAKRPWFGLDKTVQLSVTPRAQSVDVDPETQTVQLQVRPIIPLWIALLLAALFSLLLLLLPRSEPAHLSFVNSVRISHDGGSVVSGSEDCTIRRWLIDHDRLKPEGKIDTIPAKACNPLVKSTGILATAEHPFRVLAFDPEFNDRVTAGLANGTIQTWNVATRTLVDDLQDARGDRVFALAFKDTQTLYSGHAGGKIRVWQRTNTGKFQQTGKPLELSPDRNYQVRALTVSPDRTLLVSAGSRRTLVLWNLSTPNAPPKVIAQSGGQNDYIWDAVFIPGTTQLATSDSDGVITFWQIPECQATANCPTQQWQTGTAERKAGIRSIQLSPDGRQLVSGDDDGQVILWTFKTAGNLATPPDRRLLYRHQKQINTVDLLKTRQTLVVSGSDDNQVNLYEIR